MAMATPAAGIALYPPEAIAHITLPFYVKSQITEAIPVRVALYFINLS
ncbi:hypothetical protein PN492_17195 [Dolichospermum circinale CS-537/01]|uniref:Uncharacterized protein n=1 Tax=Dolichospermum circinale CS-537/01 TaxID=3021739 RepID=A0ABT5AAR8_9CYAN|nr:hypothetical protein [Dolichospermum circinale]MDB9488262.1 hypothetical protein [Dolichospermum circinale CS-537/01]